MSNLPVQIRLPEELDTELRVLAARHRTNNSHVAQLALKHCFADKKFLAKLEQSTQKSA